MKKLEKDIFKKIFLLFIGVFFTLYIVSYALLKSFVLNLAEQGSLKSVGVLYEFNLIWLKISILFLILLFGVLYILRKTTKEIAHDAHELIEYMKDISQNKNYSAVLHIKHYIEFLHISTQMKNIIKRLHKKDKK